MLSSVLTSCVSGGKLVVSRMARVFSVAAWAAASATSMYFMGISISLRSSSTG